MQYIAVRAALVLDLRVGRVVVTSAIACMHALCVSAVLHAGGERDDAATTTPTSPRACGEPRRSARQRARRELAGAPRAP